MYLRLDDLHGLAAHHALEQRRLGRGGRRLLHLAFFLVQRGLSTQRRDASKQNAEWSSSYLYPARRSPRVGRGLYVRGSLRVRCTARAEKRSGDHGPAIPPRAHILETGLTGRCSEVGPLREAVALVSQPLFRAFVWPLILVLRGSFQQ